MQLGDLIYDSNYGQIGLVVEVREDGEYCTVLYEDGIPDRSIRPREIEVINESR